MATAPHGCQPLGEQGECSFEISSSLDNLHGIVPVVRTDQNKAGDIVSTASIVNWPNQTAAGFSSPPFYSDTQPTTPIYLIIHSLRCWRHLPSSGEDFPLFLKRSGYLLSSWMVHLDSLYPVYPPQISPSQIPKTGCRNIWLSTNHNISTASDEIRLCGTMWHRDCFMEDIKVMAANLRQQPQGLISGNSGPETTFLRL